MDVYRGPAPTGEATNLALAHVLARRAEEAPGYEAIHVKQPKGRYVVFSRREIAAPGFRDATEAATRAGFTPLLRPSGERALAYTHEPLVIHHVRHAEDPRQGHQARFEYFGGKIVDTLRVLGIHAELGAVPGEYCPGAHSINARGERKLVGTAQRVLRHAWLFATLIIMGDEQLLANVLADVYRPMGASFDPDSVGSLRKENPALTNDVVTAAVLQAHTAQPSPRSLGMGSDCPLGQRLGSAS